jgi:hypothetical protein
LFIDFLEQISEFARCSMANGGEFNSPAATSKQTRAS